jgi:hypothetical protein
MISVAKYDSVISEIYEAALVPSRWDNALNQLVTTFSPRGWEVAFLIWERHNPAAGRFLGAAGVTPMARDIYLARFAGANEWSNASRKMRVGETKHSDEFVSRERFYKCPLYLDFLRHWEFDVSIVGILDRHGPDQLGLVVPGPKSSDPGELMEAIPLLMPHFYRATRISRRIGEADLRANTAADMLNHSPYAVFALGPDMRLLLANDCGQVMIEEGASVSLTSGKLKIDDSAAQAELLAMSRSKGGERAFAVNITDEKGRTHIFSALKVSENLGEQFENAAGGATLMLVGGQKLSLSGELVEQIEQSFGLTAAEARLAGHLLEGSGLEGYMYDRSVSKHAARFILKSIYSKVGISTQAGLISLLRDAPLGWTSSAPAI